jgi:hypothetical protein
MKRLSLPTLVHLQRGDRNKKVLSDAFHGKFVRNPMAVAWDCSAEGEAKNDKC